jgi:hypothetical protein
LRTLRFVSLSALGCYDFVVELFINGKKLGRTELFLDVIGY